jgi:hypothetical protein
MPDCFFKDPSPKTKLVRSISLLRRRLNIDVDSLITTKDPTAKNKQRRKYQNDEYDQYGEYACTATTAVGH